MSMKTTVWLAGLCALSGCAMSTAQSGSTVDRKEQVHSLEAFAGELMSGLAKGDFSRVKASGCPAAVVYDTDEDGKPVIARGQAEVVELLDGYQKMMSESRTTTNAIVTALSCRVDAGPGYCLIEFDQSITVGGQTMGPVKFRATLIAEPYKGGWIWTHWHASLREPFVPVMPPPAPPPTAAMLDPEPAPAAAPLAAPTTH